MFKKIAKIFFEGIKLKTKVFGPQIWWLSLNWGQKRIKNSKNVLFIILNFLLMQNLILANISFIIKQHYKMKIRKRFHAMRTFWNGVFGTPFPIRVHSIHGVFPEVICIKFILRSIPSFYNWIYMVSLQCSRLISFAAGSLPWKTSVCRL